MATPAIQTLLTDAQQVLNLNSLSEVRSTMAAALANANVGTPLNPNLTTQQLWDEFYQIVRQPESDIESIITNQLMKFLFAPPAPGGAGADQQVIFNDGGVLAGDPQFLWNKTTNLLTVTGSATITGDLTVATNKLFVNSTGVGIGTTSVLGDFTIQNGSNCRFEVTSSATGTVIENLNNARNAYLNLTMYADAYIWNRLGSTAMTLNSTGLGVGRTPATYKFEVLGNAQVIQSNFTDVAFRVSQGASTSGNKAQLLFTDSSGTIGNITSYGSAYGGGVSGALAIGTGGTDRLYVDSTGNVGVGVTPSAWGAAFKPVQLTYGSLYSQAFTVAGVAANCYNAGAGGWTYFGSGQTASRYEQSVGTHAWYTAAAGTGAIGTFTQAMTLDASGNLLVGKTTSLFSTVGIEASQTGFLSLTNSASTNASTNLSLYSTGAAAFRFYVGLAGTVFATNTTISAISDARLKENIQDLDVGLAAILALKPRKFDWKAGKGKDIKGDRGFIAQEFEQVFPQLVDEWADPAPEGEAPYKSVRQDLIPVLVKAIQELTARVQTLEAK